MLPTGSPGEISVLFERDGNQEETKRQLGFPTTHHSCFNSTPKKDYECQDGYQEEGGEAEAEEEAEAEAEEEEAEEEEEEEEAEEEEEEE